jgi:hypothetical protein
MLVSTELQRIKQFITDHTDIKLSKDSGRTGVKLITTIASAINTWGFLEQAFAEYNRRNPGVKQMDMERWSMNKGEDKPTTAEKKEIKALVEQLFTNVTNPDNIENFKTNVSNTVIEQFNIRNPETI